MSGQEPTEEELRAAMEEQLRRIRVEDVLVQTAATLVNLAGRRLGLAPDAEDERDLDQARLAIESTRALVPLLGTEDAQAIKQALSQLQMAFARQAQEAASAQGAAEGAEAGGAETGEARPSPAGQQGRRADEEAERAKARSKIWTPPGT